MASRVCILSLAALLWTLPAHAEPDTPRSYETVVTATGGEEATFESPRAIEVIDSRDLRDRPAATTPEALENELGVTMQRTNTAGGAPILRGLIGQHVLLLVDGIRLNNAITRFGPNQLLNTVDPFQIQRVEVVRGPGSVLHGSDALGGVINLISRRPAFDPRRAWDAAAMLTTRFDSADMSAMGNLGLEGHLRGFGLRVGGTLKRFGELTGGRDTGTQPFTAYREGDADVSLAWALGSSHMLRASYTAVRQLDAPRTDRSSAADFRLFAEQLRDLGSLSYSGRFDGFLLKQVDAAISLHDQRELRERFRVLDDRIERERDGARTLGAQATARGELPYTRLAVGLSLYHDWVDSTAEHEQISSPVITPLDRGRYVDDATYTQLGFFVLDRIPVTHKLAIDIGGRVSSWFIRIPRSQVNDPIDTSRTGVVGALHARYLVGDGLNLVAGVSQGFRAPNVDDFSAQGCSGQGYDVPNPDLDNEKSVTAEAGVKLDLFGMLSGSLFYFYTYLDDLIVRVPAGGPQVPCGTLDNGRPDLADRVTRDNSQTGEIHGVEASVRLELGRRWSLFSWIAWSRGQVTLDLPGNFEEPLSRVPPLNGMAGVRYSFADQWGFAELGLRWADRQDRLATGDRSDRRICPDGPEGCRGTPGYAVVTLRGAARLHDYLRLTLAVENLTNETYRIHGSGVDGAGLSAVLGMEVDVR